MTSKTMNSAASERTLRPAYSSSDIWSCNFNDKSFLQPMGSRVNSESISPQISVNSAQSSNRSHNRTPEIIHRSLSKQSVEEDLVANQVLDSISSTCISPDKSLSHHSEDSLPKPVSESDFEIEKSVDLKKFIKTESISDGYISATSSGKLSDRTSVDGDLLLAAENSVINQREFVLSAPVKIVYNNNDSIIENESNLDIRIPSASKIQSLPGKFKFACINNARVN